MSLLNEFPLRSLQFYLTAPYPCGYLLDEIARSQVATPSRLIDGRVYSELIRYGFRRSGSYVYRPQCDHCRACIPIRLIVNDFSPDRSQRRTLKRHGSLVAIQRELAFDAAHYALYRRYQTARHPGGGMDQETEEQYQQFLLESAVNTYMVEFREDGVLRMVSIIDDIQDGLSAVYTFFDPDVPQASYGTFNILWQIDRCRTHRLRYLYLGYWIEESRKMAYKSKFQPLQGLVEGRWQPLVFSL